MASSASRNPSHRLARGGQVPFHPRAVGHDHDAVAPFAHVDTLNAVEGGVIAQSWTHYNGTITSHNDLYDNPIDWP